MDEKTRKIARQLANKIIKEVGPAVREYAGTELAGAEVKTGADGTPTSFIDQIAEEKIVTILKNANVYSYLISEEIGEVKLGKGKKSVLYLVMYIKDMNFFYYFF